ncbi:hypothetical protein GCM10027029_01680 [Conyzicola lurida]
MVPRIVRVGSLLSVSSEFVIRSAMPNGAEHIAAVHAASWRETYRGTVVSDEVLDSPNFPGTE